MGTACPHPLRLQRAAFVQPSADDLRPPGAAVLLERVMRDYFLNDAGGARGESAERDMAHEADMRRLRREQLRAEEFDPEEIEVPAETWEDCVAPGHLFDDPGADVHDHLERP